MSYHAWPCRHRAIILIINRWGIGGCVLILCAFCSPFAGLVFSLTHPTTLHHHRPTCFRLHYEWKRMGRDLHTLCENNATLRISTICSLFSSQHRQRGSLNISCTSRPHTPPPSTTSPSGGGCTSADETR